MTEVVDPQLSRYSNRDLEAFLADPNASEAQKDQARQELTRRMRDELIRSAQSAGDHPLQPRRRRARRLGRLAILLIVLLICALSVLCVVSVPQMDWFKQLFGFISLLG